MPEIRPVSLENWQSLIKLKVREDQTGFVASNLYSIAQAQFGDEYEGHWDLHPFGIYDDDEVPVGFLMYGLNFNHPKQQAFIQRLMVDEKFQGKGFGRFAMEKMIEIFRADERIQEVGISYEPHNEGARELYARVGFVETGEMVEEEVVAVLKLK
ncbi:MAG TPA: GNAT family N-acetyltransferase [Anaerolineales bacterium]|nr:GNAT family N-acetyltransferase [Anaerolineales bacterium]